MIDQGFLTDPDGADIALLAEAYACAREITRQPELAALLGPQTAPGEAFRCAADLRAGLRRSVTHAYHPVSTCAMGPATDPQSVVDPSGRIHGLTGGYVIDAAIMPVAPRANTNLPSAVIAERLASILALGVTSTRGTEMETAWPESP